MSRMFSSVKLSTLNRLLQQHLVMLSRYKNLKSYVGGAFVARRTKQKTIIQSLVCEAQVAGTQGINRPVDSQTCGSGTVRIKEYIIP